jgi:hypothetical protein
MTLKEEFLAAGEGEQDGNPASQYYARWHKKQWNDLFILQLVVEYLILARYIRW